mgnify:CR=1 FL=1
MPHNILSWYTLTFSHACQLGNGSTTVSSLIYKFHSQSPGHQGHDTYPNELRTFWFELFRHIARSTKYLTINKTRRQQSTPLPTNP